MFVAIEGNSATGKTTLAKVISQALGMHCVLEPDEKILMPLYDQDIDNMLRIQIYCLSHRLKLQELIRTQRAMNGIVSDFILLKDFVYAKLLLTKEDLDAYLSLFSVLEYLGEQPDLLVYLEEPIEILLERIRCRARPFEAHIDKIFLEKLEFLCREHILTSRAKKTVILHTSESDVISNPNEIDRILVKLGLGVK